MIFLIYLYIKEYIGLCFCIRLKEVWREGDIWFLFVLVGEGYYYVEGGQGQYEVEEGVIVGYCVFFIVLYMLFIFFFIFRIRGI